MDENGMSKVYIQTDAQGRILRCEGGYSMSNIADVSEWIFIDEGTGDRYNLCQAQYFDGGLYTEDGICRYVWSDNEYRIRTEHEMEADRKARNIRRADRAYEPGEYMTIDGTLYKVALPIFAGTQITIGTNVEPTTIEAELVKTEEV